MITISQIRNEIYWKISDRLTENKSPDANVVLLPYYELIGNEYTGTWMNIQSRFSGSFGGPKINKENVLAMLSTSMLDLGKTGIVVTTEGVYFLPWTVFGTAKGYYWSHDEVYRHRQLGGDIDDIGDKYNMSNIFDPYEMVDIMNDIVAVSTSIRRKNVVDLKTLLTTCSSVASELGFLIKKESTEYKLTEGLSKLVDILGENIQKEWDFSVIQSFYTVQDEIRNNALDLLKNIEERGQKLLLSYNTQDSWYGEMLVWGSIFSLLAIDFCIHKNVVANFLVKSFYEIFNFPKLEVPEEVREHICKTIEDANANEYVTNMIRGTVELYSNWETAGEIEIYKSCVLIAAGIPYVLDGLLSGMEDLIEQERCDFIDEIYWRGSPRYYPDCTKIREKSDKQLFKCLMKVQKKLDKKGITECVHTINDASDDMINFMERLLKKIYVKSRFSYHFPLLMIRLNDFFSSGIMFCKDRIIINYLQGSPEYEMNWKEFDEDIVYYIDVAEIQNVSYIKNLKYICFLFGARDDVFELPITTLPIQYAPLLCECISELYKVIGFNIEVVEPKELRHELVEECHNIYDKMCQKGNSKIGTTGIMQKLFGN